ncbi:DUF4381 domain-containing protein [Coralloluteibacterium thermophilus]|uniref:DUF4381 domain-containing protein n=1 Tax=Coralloluteibacterium thermophilum TaxID=2707049 RepID=A0ABV9NQJ2_9GAMM
MSILLLAAQAGPELRDIHLPPPPGIWPLAWGWWVLIALGAVALGILVWSLRRRAVRRRRRAALAGAFDTALAGAGDPAARLRTMSEHLRRAARLRDPGAVALRGDAWLRFLDGDDPSRPFSAGPGRVLESGPYQARADAAAVAKAEPLVRRRYLDMTGGR